MGANKWPVISLKYTKGISGVFGSDFDYDKLRLSLTKRIKTGPLGVGYITLTGEYVFNTLPYPLLSLHLGNESFLYTSLTYNLMNYGEFVSDHFASLQYRQYLEGFLLNRLPLLNKLKWRLLATANVITGGMRQSNRDSDCYRNARWGNTYTACRIFYQWKTLCGVRVWRGKYF